MASGQSEAMGNTMRPLLPVPSHSIPRSQSFPSLAIAPWDLEVWSQPQASDDRDDRVGGPTARPCWFHWFLRAHPRSRDPCYLQSHYSLFPFVSMACQPVLMGLYFPLCSSNGFSQPVLAPGVKLPPNRSPVPHLLALLPRAMCAKGQDCGASIPKTQCRDQSSFPIK